MGLSKHCSPGGRIIFKQWAATGRRTAFICCNGAMAAGMVVGAILVSFGFFASVLWPIVISPLFNQFAPVSGAGSGRNG